MSYDADRAYGERFIPQVKQIVGPFLLQPSPFEVDAHRAADLIVLRAESVEIGVRIRRPQYLGYRDFTIRSERDSGSTTEAQKVLQGFMRWFFYGWAADTDEPQLARWLLVDMNEFRRVLAMRGLPACMDAGAISRRSNGDGTHFWAVNPERFGRRLIIAASEPTEPKAA